MHINSFSHVIRIGVFDSGVGGLSVLKALYAELSGVELFYVADSAYAPYGERSESEILKRVNMISRFLKEQGCHILVIACNTATAAAIHEVRRLYPDWLVVGVEPGLKPAVQRTRNRRIGVMATTATLASQKFQRLIAEHGQGVEVYLQACPGLAYAIESGDLHHPDLLRLIADYTHQLLQQKIDTLVLGCTHYPFIRPQLQASLGPDVDIIDTSEAVARRAALLLAPIQSLLTENTSISLSEPPLAKPNVVHLWSTREPERLSQIALNWLNLSLAAQLLPLQPN